MLGPNDIPVIVQHMALAIFTEGKLTGPRHVRFQHALRIALGRCQQYGFVVGTMRFDDATRIELTQQGALRSRTHAKEVGATNKARRFRILYAEAFGETQKGEPDRG